MYVTYFLLQYYATYPSLFILTIYAPMIYTAPCVMFLMRADALRGEVGPSEIARADRRVQFWAHFPT